MIICKANCKINIGLDILRKREDGYHELSTVMYPIEGLHDIVRVEIAPKQEVSLCVVGTEIDCPAEENICYKAARLMQQEHGAGGVQITLEKNVPFGAGLGGGSADGTAVIVAINKLYELQLSEQQLIEAAAMLGSDTAFFVRNTPQLCTGRGELMQPIELSLAGLWIVIIKPEVYISTREAYAGVRPHYPATPLEERIAQNIELWQGSVTNGFEEHILAAHPEIAEIKEALMKAGAVYASMSGSGSAIYGLYKTEEAAQRLSHLTPYIYKL